MTARRSLAVMLVLGVFAAGIGVCLNCATSRRDASSHVMALRATPDGDAIVVFEQEGGLAWLERISADGSPRWRRLLPDRPREFVESEHGLVVHDDVVMVVVETRHQNRLLVAYRIADGAWLWMTTLPDGRVDRQWSGLAAGRAAYFRMENSLVVVDVHTGATRSFQMDGVSRILVLASNGLIVGGRSGAYLYDVDTVEPRSISGFTHACRLADSVITVESTTGEMESMVAGATPLPHLRVPSTPRSRLTLDHCGTYRDRYVWLLTTAEREETRAVVEFARDGTIVGSLSVGGWSSDPQMGRSPEQTSFAGAMPRFVPYIASMVDRSELLMVDMEHVAIAWQVAISPADQLYRDGSFWYVAGSVGNWIAAFDGDSGRLSAAAAIESGSALKLGPEHVDGGSVWLYTYRWSPELPLAALDAKTLVPRFDHGVGVTDAPEIRARFATPASGGR